MWLKLELAQDAGWLEVSFSILQRIDVAETNHRAMTASEHLAFSILQRIDVAETQLGDRVDVLLRSFSILQRIDVAETAGGTWRIFDADWLSVSSSGSMWLKLGAELCPHNLEPSFSILQRIDVAETTRREFILGHRLPLSVSSSGSMWLKRFRNHPRAVSPDFQYPPADRCG